jgi:hypothetical protein
LTGFAAVFHRVLQGYFMVTRARIRQVAGPVAEADPPESDEITTGNIEPEDDPEADALSELRGLGAGGEYKYTVSRVSSEPGRKAGYCRVYALGDLSLDSIREEFGGGKYRIRVTDAGGQYVAIQTVDIVELPRPKDAPAVAVAPGADLTGIAALLQSVKPSGEGGGIAPILALMMKQQESTTNMIVAMMNRPVPQGPSITDILSIINANKQDKTDPVALLLQGLELGKNIGGAGESSMLDIAREGLGIIAPLIKEGQKTPAPAQLPHRGPPAQIAPIPNATGTAPIVPLATPGEVAGETPVRLLQQINWIRKQLEVLLHHAARGKDPELYAEVLLDNLPPFITPAEIMQHIGADDAVAKLAQLDERVNQHPEWFAQFRDAIREFLEPDDETAPGVDMPTEGGGE